MGRAGGPRRQHVAMHQRRLAAAINVPSPRAVAILDCVSQWSLLLFYTMVLRMGDFQGVSLSYGGVEARLSSL